MDEGGGPLRRLLLALVICATMAASYLLVDEWLFHPPEAPAVAAAKPRTSSAATSPTSKPRKKRRNRLSLRQVARLLPSAPEKLQLGLIRQVARIPVSRSAPVLEAFMQRPDKVHPGALLEAIAQMKRGGRTGAARLVRLYPKLVPDRRELVVQAFEAYRHEGDGEVLAQMTLDAKDPLRTRWEVLRLRNKKNAKASLR